MGKRRRTRPHIQLFNAFVLGTAPRTYIHVTEAEIRSIPKPVTLLLSDTYPRLSSKVTISTKALKHIYDDHTIHSIEIVSNLAAVIGSPDAVYENKKGRAGAYIFTATRKGRVLCAIIDIIAQDDLHVMQVRTAFYTSKPRLYLGGSKCVWENVSRFVEPGGQHTPPS